MQPNPEQVEQFNDPVWGAERLKEIPLFKVFDVNQLQELYKLGKVDSLPRGSHAVIEGEPTRGLYLILHGSLSVFKSDSATGESHRLAAMEAGESFGELSLFDDAPRSATVMAELLSYTFSLDSANFEAFLEKSGPEVMAQFYKNCAVSLSEKFRTLNQEYINSQQLLWKYALSKRTNPE